MYFVCDKDIKIELKKQGVVRRFFGFWELFGL